MRPRVGVVGVVMVACLVAAGLTLRAHARADAERLYVDMVACLVGRERVTTSAEAAVRFRRLYPEPTQAVLAACSVAADEVHRSWARRLFHRELVRSADDVADTTTRGAMPRMLDLLARSRDLAWSPRPGSPEAPTFFLDRDLPTLRAALPGSDEPSDYERREERETTSLRLGDVTIALTASPHGEWSALRWAGETPPVTDAWTEDGSVYVGRGANRRCFGPGAEAHVVGEALLIRLRDQLIAHRLDASDDDPGSSVTLPSRAHLSAAQACELGRTWVVAIPGQASIAILALNDATISSWGVVERAREVPPDALGAWVLSCDRDVARIAYAVSHPGTSRDPLTFDHAPFIPEPTRRHGIISAKCDSSGCTQREALVHGVDTFWVRPSEWTPTPYWIAPDVVAFGERILLVWSEGLGFRYRVGRLDQLDRAESRWLVETRSWELDGSPAERAIRLPYVRLRARFDVAIIQMNEGLAHGGTFLVRFHADDPPTPLLAPPRPPRPD